MGIVTVSGKNGKRRMKKILHIRLYILATLLLLTAAGQGALAETTTYTVTYTITSAALNSSTNKYDIVFTRSGDPFDASATTYTTSVDASSIGQNPGYNGSFLRIKHIM